MSHATKSSFARVTTQEGPPDLAEIHMRLPTVQQGVLIKEAIDKGSIGLSKETEKDTRICCYMGWLEHTGDNSFTSTSQGKLLVGRATNEGCNQYVDYSAHDKVAMKSFKKKLPTKRQSDALERTLKTGYIYAVKVTHEELVHMCQMGWLLLQEGGRFYLTHLGKFIIDNMPK